METIIPTIWIIGGLSAWAYMGYRDGLFDDWLWYPMAFNACIGGPFTWIVAYPICDSDK